MDAIRQFLHRHRRLALLLVVIAFAVKALVPTGYMVGGQGRVLTVSICADASGAQLTRQIVVPRTSGTQENGAGHAKGTACAFSALGMAGIGGADAALIALALAYILALGFTLPVASPLVPRAHLRPPLRGPPALS